MVQTLMSATTFLNLSNAWQYWLVGGATLIAASLYSLRGVSFWRGMNGDRRSRKALLRAN
ncbi:hypothetical protein O4H62_22560 [Hoeflea alexandrii]|nr:hypothetical protein [Hoeflea alexandrii]